MITTRRLDGQSIEWLRVTMHSAHYYQGNERTPAETAFAIHGLDHADLEEIADDWPRQTQSSIQVFRCN